jgi:hypothetical protein
MELAAWSRLVSRRSALSCFTSLLFLIVSAGQNVHAQPAAQSVRLIVDYGDGVIKIFDQLPWSKGNTVLDVLNSAKVDPHAIDFHYHGQGASAFLDDIDNLKNQGAGSASKNWQYWVNTAYAQESFAVSPVQAADTVFWRFTTDQGK